MAGDWIKMRCNLWDHPRVAQICDATDVGEATVVGALFWLWSTADQHSDDGLLVGLSLRQIDRKTGVPGFGDAVVAAGWLVAEGANVRIPEFEEHNGSSAKKRMQTARRVAAHKAGNAADVDVGAVGGEAVTHELTEGNAVSVTKALAVRDLEKRREEKREEGKPSVARPADAAPPTDGAERLPACPVAQLVDLYHEVLPELPRCRLMPEDRSKAIKRRWSWVLTSKKPDGVKRAQTSADGMAWFRSYFERARCSDHLMGRVARAAGHEGWQCDLDFLLGDKGMKAVIEKTEVTA